MNKAIINSIKKSLNDYNNYKSRIKELEAQNKQLADMYNHLTSMEISDNIEIAKTAINDEIELNNQYISEYTAKLNSFDDNIDRLYDDSRDYKHELRIDAMNTFETMVSNATSDYKNGYSYDVFKRQNDRANEWLVKRVTYLDDITDNPTAFATMINLGLGTLD